MKDLTSQYLSEFCGELALLVRSGISVVDALALMRDDEDDRASRALLAKLTGFLEAEPILSDALEKTELFPEYFLGSIRLGERTGRLDETLAALSTYYERRAWFEENLRKAVAYPLLLIVLMAAVVVVLITKVLPIFSEVFDQVGAEMSATATALMRFGGWLSSASTVLLTILAALIILGLLVYYIPALRRSVTGAYLRRHNGRGLVRRVSQSQFALAMSMAVSSGLGPEEAVSLAGNVCAKAYGMQPRAEACQKYLESGESLENSLLRAEIFSRRDSRLLGLGAKTGNADEVMSQIAERGENEAIGEMDDRLRRVEPTLVIIISIIVGLILFSVMLPLMGIMSSLG